MRTIKFRGKRVDGRGWAIGGSLLLPTTDNVTTRIIAWNGARFEVVPETVGQFTGITDKNGVEIYEGDVFKRILNKNKRFDFPDDFSDFWFVEWLDETAGFTTTKIGDLFGGIYKIKELKRNSFSQRFNEADEIIGNIHDNPELLK